LLSREIGLNKMSLEINKFLGSNPNKKLNSIVESVSFFKFKFKLFLQNMENCEVRA
jgi:hypothetical protein